MLYVEYVHYDRGGIRPRRILPLYSGNQSGQWRVVCETRPRPGLRRHDTRSRVDRTPLGRFLWKNVRLVSSTTAYRTSGKPAAVPEDVISGADRATTSRAIVFVARTVRRSVSLISRPYSTSNTRRTPLHCDVQSSVIRPLVVFHAVTESSVFIRVAFEILIFFSHRNTQLRITPRRKRTGPQGSIPFRQDHTTYCI